MKGSYATKYRCYKCCQQCFISHHHLPPLSLDIIQMYSVLSGHHQELHETHV